MNEQFTGGSRQLVFWYDAGGQFADDIEQLQLDHAKVYRLEEDNQFYTKYFLECVDTTTSYLIYAPYARPALRDNKLADTLKYSKEFYADLASLICVDLGIHDDFKPVIQKHIAFFTAKPAKVARDRTQRFYELEIEKWNKTVIETALISVLCGCRTASFEEVVRSVIIESSWGDNKYFAAIERFGLAEAFWQLCESTFVIP